MKRRLLLFLIVVMVLITCGLWYLKSGVGFKPVDLIQFGVITLIVVFALYVGIRKLQSARRGEPSEDELSKMVMQKTAALSFYISLYLWVGILFLKDWVKLDDEQLIGSGILGMGLVFAISWLIINFKGTRNE